MVPYNLSSACSSDLWFRKSTVTVTFTEDHNGDKFKVIQTQTFKFRVYIGNIHLGDEQNETKADAEFDIFEDDTETLVSLGMLLEPNSEKELDPNLPAHALWLEYLQKVLEALKGWVSERHDIANECVFNPYYLV
ncbi:MAG: hypothetical protein Q9184_007069 [Pyrenodesmia sp. 2 TL-2023]